MLRFLKEDSKEKILKRLKNKADLLVSDMAAIQRAIKILIVLEQNFMC